MKIMLKIILFLSACFFLLGYTGDTNKTKMQHHGYYSDIAKPGAYKSRTYDTAIVRESPFREMRNNSQLPDMDEIRRQRNIERNVNIEWIKQVTRKFSSDSWYLLMKYDSLPLLSSAPALNGGVVSSHKTAETFDYLRGRTKGDLLSSMEKNVHEISHAYFDQNVYRYLLDKMIEFDPDNANGFIYINPYQGFFISFPLKAMYPSNRLSTVIPASLRTFRYDTYIKGETSTQSDGVIGLLNELHAYYCGSRYCHDVLEAYKIASASNAAGLFEWVTHTQSTMSAFYEFDFFIREYLLYMKKNYTDSYELLRNYKPFTESYNILLVDYNDLINKYISTIEYEMSSINSTEEAEVKIDDNWLWVKTAGSHISSGTPIFSEDRDKLIPVLQGKRYREIEKDFNIE
jgi:hypothetical protein